MTKFAELLQPGSIREVVVCRTGLELFAKEEGGEAPTSKNSEQKMETAQVAEAAVPPMRAGGKREEIIEAVRQGGGGSADASPGPGATEPAGGPEGTNNAGKGPC